MKHTMLAVWKHNLPPHCQVQSLQMGPFLIQKRELLSFQHQVRIMSFMIFRIMLFKASLCKFCTWYDMWLTWHSVKMSYSGIWCPDYTVSHFTRQLCSFCTLSHTHSFKYHDGHTVIAEVLTAVLMKIWLFWDVMACSLIDCFQRPVTVYQSRLCNKPEDLNLRHVHSLIIFVHCAHFI